MTKILITLLTISLFSFTLAKESNDFVGKWSGEDQGEIGFIIFDKDGFASFEIDGEIFGGKNFLLEGEKAEMSYEINNAVDPIQLDFILTKIDSGDQIEVLCIAKFEDKDNMQFAINFENERPKNFDSDNSIKLKRVK